MTNLIRLSLLMFLLLPFSLQGQQYHFAPSANSGPGASSSPTPAPTPTPTPTPTPSFSVSVAKKYIPVEAPTKADLPALKTSITVTAEKGFSDTVKLLATVPATGITLALDPAELTGSGSVTLTITVTTAAQPGEYPIQIDANSGAIHKSSVIMLGVGVGGEFDLVLGIGSLIVNTNVTDYKLNDQSSVLETTNLGRATPQLLTGAAFRLPFGNFSRGATNRFGPRPWYAFLSLKFSPQSSQTFSGYVIGGSYKLSSIFSVLAGYALTPVQEPSPGFRAAAVQVVSQNPNVPIYQRFDPVALQHNSLNAYDGFPLFVQNAAGATNVRLFNGDPTVVHYHGGLVIGVAIPIKLQPQLGGGGK